MAGLGPCPLAGQLLADHGADVIVIDRKSRKPDSADINNRSKRSVALDLKSPAGVTAALRIIAAADALIEGFRPGVMEQLGLGPDACLAANPRLVYGRMTGWGQTGPLASTAGHDLGYLAVSGALSAIGAKGEPPVPPLNLVADYGGGTMFLLFGVLMALLECQRSGKGQVVDAAMVDGVPAMMGLIHSLVARGVWKGEREANLLDGGAPFYRCYAARDGKYLAVAPLEPKFFAELCAVAGIDPAHKADQYDTSNWRRRADEYASLFKTRTRDEWVALFAGSDACVAPVLGFDEVENHPHNAARGTFLRVGGVLQAAPAPRLSRTPASAPGLPAAAGGDAEKILRDAGLTGDEIAQLQQDRVLR